MPRLICNPCAPSSSVLDARWPGRAFAVVCCSVLCHRAEALPILRQSSPSFSCSFSVPILNAFCRLASFSTSLTATVADPSACIFMLFNFLSFLGVLTRGPLDSCHVRWVLQASRSAVWISLNSTNKHLSTSYCWHQIAGRR